MVQRKFLLRKGPVCALQFWFVAEVSEGKYRISEEAA